MGIIDRMRELDLYSKPLEDFRIKTLSGGAVTVISSILMVILFISELNIFMTKEIVEELFVDSSTDDDRLPIQFDFSFPNIACAFLSIDIMDVSGFHQADIQHSVWKVRQDKHGNDLPNLPEKQDLNTGKPKAEGNETNALAEVKCGSCYGAETPHLKCCDTCDDVRLAYRVRGWAMRDLDTVDQCKAESWVEKREKFKDEGCRLHGSVKVAKVAGNFHVAPGETLKESHSHVHDLHHLKPSSFETSHTITHLSFGAPFPGKPFPLDNHTVVDTKSGTMFQYYLKVVPTVYSFDGAEEIRSHQFSLTKHQKVIESGISDGLPGIFVQYEFSPLQVKYSEKNKPISHLAVSMCAIIGGLYTVASILDSFIYHSTRILQQKTQLGKGN